MADPSASNPCHQNTFPQPFSSSDIFHTCSNTFHRLKVFHFIKNNVPHTDCELYPYQDENIIEIPKINTQKYSTRRSIRGNFLYLYFCVLVSTLYPCMTWSTAGLFISEALAISFYPPNDDPADL